MTLVSGIGSVKFHEGSKTGNAVEEACLFKYVVMIMVEPRWVETRHERVVSKNFQAKKEQCERP